MEMEVKVKVDYPFDPRCMLVWTRGNGSFQVDALFAFSTDAYLIKAARSKEFPERTYDVIELPEQ